MLPRTSSPYFRYPKNPTAMYRQVTITIDVFSTPFHPIRARGVRIYVEDKFCFWISDCVKCCSVYMFSMFYLINIMNWRTIQFTMQLLFWMQLQLLLIKLLLLLTMKMPLKIPDSRSVEQPRFPRMRKWPFQSREATDPWKQKGLNCV